jgi:hypothetical protein
VHNLEAVTHEIIHSPHAKAQRAQRSLLSWRTLQLSAALYLSPVKKERSEGIFENNVAKRSLEKAIGVWIFCLANFAALREMLNDGWFLCPFLPAGHSG